MKNVSSDLETWYQTMYIGNCVYVASYIATVLVGEKFCGRRVLQINDNQASLVWWCPYVANYSGTFINKITRKQMKFTDRD